MHRSSLPPNPRLSPDIRVSRHLRNKWLVISQPSATTRRPKPLHHHHPKPRPPRRSLPALSSTGPLLLPHLHLPYHNLSVFPNPTDPDLTPTVDLDRSSTISQRRSRTRRTSLDGSNRLSIPNPISPASTSSLPGSGQTTGARSVVELLRVQPLSYDGQGNRISTLPLQSLQGHRSVPSRVRSQPSKPDESGALRNQLSLLDKFSTFYHPPSSLVCLEKQRPLPRGRPSSPRFLSLCRTTSSEDSAPSLPSKRLESPTSFFPGSVARGSSTAPMCAPTESKNITLTSGPKPKRSEVLSSPGNPSSSKPTSLCLRSLGRVLPHGCEVLWEPRANDRTGSVPKFGFWRWKVARGTQTRGMLVFDEEGSSVVLPRTLEMFQDEAEGEGSMCWTCNEYEVHCGSFSRVLVPGWTLGGEQAGGLGAFERGRL
ncbi:hypothetical protein BDY24DRAFT_93368 [Mrakia frigida]|uniref:uncharacterized protein n=1 Tax=Mrakia frigida TaxID=29902 RepID=UPI003FCC1284